MSVIIVNFNGKKWLEGCLSSLERQTYQNIEIIVVDNNSSDGSLAFLQRHYPGVRVVETGENLGFSGGNNIGYEQSGGDYILLLNSDTTVGRTFVSDFKEAFEELPNAGCVQSKLVLMDNPMVLDSAGSFWTASTFLYHYGNGKSADDVRYTKTIQTFSNKGASIMLKREVIDKVGLFDADFWCYYEETDLCNRLWSAGYDCWYYPKAIVRHAGGGTALTFSSDFIQFHNFKNKLLSFLKNFEKKSLVKIIPTYILINVALSIFWLFSGKPKHTLALYRSIGWNVKHLPETMKKRAIIQKLRQRSDKEIFTAVKRRPRTEYYKYLLAGRLEAYED